MRMFTALCLIFSAALVQGADTWTRVSDFPAQRLHAAGNTVVAWDQYRVSVSVDGGYSWSQAITPAPPAGQVTAPIGIVTATVTPQGPIVILANGQALAVSGAALVATPLPPVSGIEVAGDQETYLEGADGTVYHLVGGVAQPVARGRIYRAVEHGVLIQTGDASVSFCDATGAVKPVRFAGRQLPPVFQLAAPTGLGSNKWLAKDGTLWVYQDNKITDLNRRQVTAVNYFTSEDGYQEFIVYQAQQQITWETKGGFQAHLRSEGIPPATQRIAAGPNSFVAVNQDGIWVVDNRRTR